jgi:hypothetical protein
MLVSRSTRDIFLNLNAGCAQPSEGKHMQQTPLSLEEYLATLLRTGFAPERALDLAREYALALLHGTGGTLLALVAGQMEEAARACGVHAEQVQAEQEACGRLSEQLRAQVGTM